MRKHTRVILVLIVGLAMAAALAQPARAMVSDSLTVRQGVSGSAEIGYTSYDATDHGRKVLDASSFVQKYSLLYSARGRSRFESSGNYSVTVGYEWASVDASASTPTMTAEQSVRSGRLLYDARFSLNPPTSPYQLTMYSSDMGRGSTVTDSLALLSNGGSSIVAPGLITDLTNTGTNIASGARLVISSKRGAIGTLNKYLADVPAIIIDWQDQLSRNTEGTSRLDTHLSRFKLSAGGMGETWLHYQVTDLADKYFKENSFNSSRILFGTIDQNQRRKWVQFTNWIKLSADARFERQKYGDASKNEEEFDLNIFGMATRRLWTAKVFSNYNRKVVGGGFEEKLRLPLFASGVLGAESDWSFSVSTSESRSGSGIAPASRSGEDSLSVRLNTFKRSPFTLSSTLTLTNNSNSSGGGTIGADLGLETVSTSRFHRNLNMAGSYNLHGSYNRDGESTSYNQDMLLTAHYQPAPDWKITFRESVMQGKNNDATSGLASSLLLAQGQNPLGTTNGQGVTTSTYLRFATSLAAAWTPAARVSFNLSGTNYVQMDSTGSSMANGIETGLYYGSPTLSSTLSGSAAIQDTGDSQYSASINTAYSPNRSFKASLRGRYGERKSADATYTLVDAAQRLTYFIWGSRGISRKVADLYEELAYVQENGETPKKSFTLAGVYYLYARISLNGRATYSLQNGDLAQVYGVGLAANMKLLDATVDYTYAKRASDKRVENRLAATLRKTF